MFSTQMGAPRTAYMDTQFIHSIYTHTYVCICVSDAKLHVRGYLQHIHDDPYAPNIAPLIVSATTHHFRCWNSHTRTNTRLCLSQIWKCVGWMKNYNEYKKHTEPKTQTRLGPPLRSLICRASTGQRLHGVPLL